MGFFDIFKKKPKRTLLDEFNDSAITLFRAIGQSNGTAPTNQTSDEEILKISQEVMTAFKQAAESKGETIPGGFLITIAMKFFIVYETYGDKLYYEHLDYELKKYIHEGLRDDYKIDMF
jgi:hypothetical protein